MTLAVNGQSRVPPGFRFHPTEEELLYYYLKKKVSFEKIDLDVIRDVDLNKLEPWELQERCRIGSTPQNDWYFFSHKDKKYPTGTRTNRATAAGFWKATGRDKAIHMNFKKIGMRKTLVFYKGRAPHGQKTDWIMHEYRLEDADNPQTNAFGEQQEDGWVVCRVFKKRNHQRGHEPTETASSKQFGCSSSNKQLLAEIDCSGTEALTDPYDQHLNICKQELGSLQYPTHNNSNSNCFSSHHDQFLQLPQLESPKMPSPTVASGSMKRSSSMPESLPTAKRPFYPFDMVELDQQQAAAAAAVSAADFKAVEDIQNLQDWTVLDRLVASHLNQEDPPKDLNLRSLYSAAPEHLTSDVATAADMALSFRIHRPSSHDFACETDIWNFAK